MSILVTGGAGYIGSHCVLELLSHNEKVGSMHLTKKTNEVTDSADRPACECECDYEVTPAMISAGVSFAEPFLQDCPLGDSSIRFLVEEILGLAMKAHQCSRNANSAS